ncbi:hypothetical protein D9M69_645240 [compost metagenome]
MASAWPSTVTHTVGDRTTRASADTSPARPPQMAPRVVRPFQYMAMISTGKLADAAMPKVSPTRKAMFTSSKRMPRPMATTPRPTTAMRETRISWASLALPPFSTVT